MCVVVLVVKTLVVKTLVVKTLVVKTLANLCLVYWFPRRGAKGMCSLAIECVLLL